MSAEELRRAGVLSRVGAGELKQLEAAEWLGLSYRQTKRLWQPYRQEGAAGLVHGNVGQRSHHAKPEAFRRRVVVRELRDGSLQLLYQRQQLAWREIQQRPLRSAQPLPRVRRVRVVPPADHPWRRPLRPQQQPPETEIHRDNGRRAVEMTGCGKPEAGFPHPLGNSPTTRVSHIPTAPTTTATHTPKGTFLSRLDATARRC